MQRTLTASSNSDALTRQFNRALRRCSFFKDGDTTINHRPNEASSTYSSEIVTCLRGDGSTMALLFKHSATADQVRHGLRGGISYEAAVNRHILQPLLAAVPALYGAGVDAATRESWAFFQYLENSAHPGNRNPAELPAAARWIGEFHSLTSKTSSSLNTAFLHDYDRGWFTELARRTSQATRDLHQEFPWLPSLCANFESVIDDFLTPPLPIVHGEYYGNNILISNEHVFPVDWETAALAPGEIDLAALIEGKWPAPLVRECIREYEISRWPEGTRSNFAQRLDLARLYLHFRSLGGSRKKASSPKRRWRYETMRPVAERLGII